MVYIQTLTSNVSGCLKHRASMSVLPATVWTAIQRTCGYRFRSSAASTPSVGQLC